MSIEKKYKKLDEIEHVLIRPGRYIGSTVPHTSDEFLIVDNKFEKRENTYVPGVLKLFDEIITNSVDHSKTEAGSHVTTIKVDICRETKVISVYDDGGIPVVKHKEHDQYIPEMIFELRSGSNFNDEEQSESRLGGTHGEGASLTNIFSTSFIVHTADGKNSFYQEHTDNSRTKTKPIVKKSKDKFTKITYTLDFDKLKLTSEISDGDYAKIIKRVYDVAGCNPKLKVFLNDEQIQINSFKDYIKMYTDEYVFDSTDDWRVGVSKSDGSFSHVSFVNSVETKIGGQHVEYIAYQIIAKLREYIAKKHRIQVKPSEIKNHLNLFIDADINKPKFDSQTKENMITEIKNFGTTFEITDNFIKSVVKSSIVQSILDWAQAKENALLQAELRKLNKTTDRLDPIRVDKFEDASEKKNRSLCTVLLTEGDSASKAILNSRNPKLHAVYPLKGKPLNVLTIDPKRLMDNEVFKNVLTITGLKLGEKVESLSQLRFGKLVILTDADCVTEEHYTLTESGEKLVSDVNVGDKVLTHTGQYKTVEYVCEQTKTQIIRIRSGNTVIECSPDHKQPVVRSGAVQIVLAKDILPTDLILSKKK
jgi:DNA gyrase/topoisomerase IV subunit B